MSHMGEERGVGATSTSTFFLKHHFSTTKKTTETKSTFFSFPLAIVKLKVNNFSRSEASVKKSEIVIGTGPFLTSSECSSSDGCFDQMNSKRKRQSSSQQTPSTSSRRPAKRSRRGPVAGARWIRLCVCWGPQV
ncbi:uncharacterized protein isoform X1 [Danio rerio]|uniref:Uncharacterized protein isoform X1 n=1 Tax=Danio rerio TaxID=7955 RepID=A0AC58GL90_DANRE